MSAQHPCRILLAGASGIPGRDILASLLQLRRSQPSINLQITLLKRTAGEMGDGQADLPFEYTYLKDYSDINALKTIIQKIHPHVIISALNAEPAPVLDNYFITALSESDFPGASSILYINGYTLDLMHPCVSQLPDQGESLAPKIDFAKRLAGLGESGRIQYCTIVNASFLDYTLVKGYNGIDLNNHRATIYNGGDHLLTGCSLKFVGDAVAEVVRIFLLGTEKEKNDIINKRVRIAETQYSGNLLLAAVEKVTGAQFDITHVTMDASTHPVRMLNWNGQGAASFQTDGLHFGEHGGLKGRRRTLEEIVKKAISGGVEAFEGIGR